MLGSSKMTVYSVYLDPNAPRPFESAVFVPEGFNMYAFLFTGLWAMTKKLWVLMIAFFVLHIGSTYAASYVGLSAGSIAVIGLGCRTMIGLCAADMWCAALERKGWVASDVIVAYSELEATHRYFGRHLRGDSDDLDISTTPATPKSGL